MTSFQYINPIVETLNRLEHDPREIVGCTDRELEALMEASPAGKLPEAMLEFYRFGGRRIMASSSIVLNPAELIQWTTQKYLDYCFNEEFLKIPKYRSQSPQAVIIDTLEEWGEDFWFIDDLELPNPPVYFWGYGEFIDDVDAAYPDAVEVMTADGERYFFQYAETLIDFYQLRCEQFVSTMEENIEQIDPQQVQLTREAISLGYDALDLLGRELPKTDAKNLMQVQSQFEAAVERHFYLFFYPRLKEDKYRLANLKKGFRDFQWMGEHDLPIGAPKTFEPEALNRIYKEILVRFSALMRPFTQ